MASGSLRRRYIGPGCTLLEEVSTIGWTQVRRADVQDLLPHQHPGWEVTWVRQGRLDWLIDGQALCINAGQCVVVGPGEVHSARSGSLQPSEIYWITFPASSAAKTGVLAALLPLLARAPRCVAGHQGLAAPWDELISEMTVPDRWSIHACRGSLGVLCARLARCLTARQAVAVRSPAVARAVAWVEMQRSWIQPIAALAREAGIAPATLHARFIAEVGQSPSAWMRRRRVEEAQRLLGETRLGITVIAARLGFHSSQHFATQFRRSTGSSPLAWRRQAQQA